MQPPQSESTPRRLTLIIVLKSAQDTYENQTDIMEKVPNEIIVKIFSYLSHRELIGCAKVSKRFEGLTKNEELWKTINWTEKSVNFEGIKYALACGTKYLKLHKAQIRYLAMTNFRTKSKLKYLDLRQKTEVYLESASQAILPEFEKGM